MENKDGQKTLEEMLQMKADAEKKLGISSSPTQEQLSAAPKDYMSPWQKFKEAQGSTRPWDMLKADGKTTDDIAQERYNMCLGCEHLINLTKQCKKCGCFMNLKTKLAGAECPVGKWAAVDTLEEGE